MTEGEPDLHRNVLMGREFPGIKQPISNQEITVIVAMIK